MTWIKICGITNTEDALTAVDAGADALGFVFHAKSPRRVDPESVWEIAGQLPASVEKVGVFVDADLRLIRATVSTAGLTAIQLHGKYSMDSFFSQPLDDNGVPKVIAVVAGDSLKSERIDLEERVRQRAFAVLLDSRCDGAAGGTGTMFDWESTRGTVQNFGCLVPVIVAGGLNPSNVGQAMKLFEPFGVDVSSGVEARPGKKDREKVRDFVAAVRRRDQES